MSKMLLPTELDTAMSPRPFRATITLVIRSGMEVPAARMVSPMISSEMPTVSPTCQQEKVKTGVSSTEDESLLRLCNTWDILSVAGFLDTNSDQHSMLTLSLYMGLYFLFTKKESKNLLVFILNIHKLVKYT